MSSQFPLLRLPGVVLSEVFKSLNIEEKVKLSLCSKKIFTQINNAQFYSQKVIVGLDVLNQSIEVYSENIKDAFEIFNCSYTGTINNLDIQQCQIEGRVVPVISFAKGISIFWENHQEGFLSVIRYLLKIFRCKFSMYNNYNSDSYKNTISELFNLQVEFKKLTIYLRGSEDEHLFWNRISNKFGFVEDLIILCPHDPDFRPVFRPVFTSWPQKIYILNSDWFTLNSFLKCPCTTITLWNSTLGNKELDLILKNWKTGGFPNIEFMKITSHNISNNGTTILGMNLMQLNGKVIQTDDGSKKATFKPGNQRIEISVTLFQ
ncbi:hypothetical protein CRE_21975 [Caenorhabditis remanei]|uniref:F-box domain-containing protein n=1 Tax=Caenorhabditis remanei TaxID=31234 RepID=E3N3D7_CAERE|nr:hypothetical protein CRE_21975 [Caenorhabditis remanei]